MSPLRGILLVLALLLPGCLGDWGLTGVSATALFLDETWDAAKAAEGLRAAGFEPRQAGGAVSATNGSLGVTATSLANGTVQLSVVYTLVERAATRSAAEARAEEAIREREPEVARILADFERGSGWTRDAPLRWDQGVLHGD